MAHSLGGARGLTVSCNMNSEEERSPLSLAKREIWNAALWTRIFFLNAITQELTFRWIWLVSYLV